MYVWRVTTSAGSWSSVIKEYIIFISKKMTTYEIGLVSQCSY